MMYSDSQLLDILRHFLSMKVENEVFDFKEAKTDFHFSNLGKYFSALSNEANLSNVNSAWLIFGIADDRRVVGTKYRTEEKKLQSLKKEIADKTNERITFREIYVLTCEGKRVILFEIPPAIRGVPTSFDGFCYGREGESLLPLSGEERERILSQSRIVDWSKEIISEATLNDLDTEAISAARANYLKKYPHLTEEIQSWSDEVFLNKAKVTIRGKITNTAILLLGKAESKHMVSPADAVIRWILKDRDGVELDYYIGDGPFILEVENVGKRIRNLKFRYLQQGTLFPEEVDMYDPYTIREALHNAVAHQDYRLGVRITVVETPDSLIFHNAGSFLPGSVEEVISRDVPCERYRNEFLVGAMQNLSMVDTIGSGIRRMFESQRKKFFPMPDYRISDESVTVTIFGKVLNQEYARILAQNSNLSLSEIMLLDKVQKHEEISVEAAAYLRKKQLIEGRRPNYYLSREVAGRVGLRVHYTVSKGMDKQYYHDFILQGISQHGRLSRQEVEDLLWQKLPDHYDTDEKKKKKVEHLLGELRTKGLAYAVREGKHSYWYLVG